MKEFFEEVKVEIIVFEDTQDIITTSPGVCTLVKCGGEDEI